jgi:hypothetical protein
VHLPRQIRHVAHYGFRRVQALLQFREQGHVVKYPLDEFRMFGFKDPRSEGASFLFLVVPSAALFCLPLTLLCEPLLQGSNRALAMLRAATAAIT